MFIIRKMENTNMMMYSEDLEEVKEDQKVFLIMEEVVEIVDQLKDRSLPLHLLATQT